MPISAGKIVPTVQQPADTQKAEQKDKKAAVRFEKKPGLLDRLMQKLGLKANGHASAAKKGVAASVTLVEVVLNIKDDKNLSVEQQGFVDLLNCSPQEEALIKQANSSTSASGAGKTSQVKHGAIPSQTSNPPPPSDTPPPPPPRSTPLPPPPTDTPPPPPPRSTPLPPPPTDTPPPPPPTDTRLPPPPTDIPLPPPPTDIPLPPPPRNTLRPPPADLPPPLPSAMRAKPH